MENNTFLNKIGDKKSINVIRVSFKWNDTKITPYQNLKKKAKRACKGKIIALNAYFYKRKV